MDYKIVKKKKKMKVGDQMPNLYHICSHINWKFSNSLGLIAISNYQ